jgi:hypothetical protein
VYASYDEGPRWHAPNVLLYIPAYADVSAMSFSATRVFIATPTNSYYSNANSELPTAPSGIWGISNNETIGISVSPNPELSNEFITRISFARILIESKCSK